MGLLLSIPLVLILPAVVLALSKIFENSKMLKLPAPSFKVVGPSKTPRVPAKEEGKYKPNYSLQKAKVLFKDQVIGSESVAVSPDGLLYMLDRYGYVLRAKPGTDSQVEKIAHLGPGRPLGFHFNAEGDLFICNAGTGLQKVEKKTGKIVLLSSVAPVSLSGTKETPIHYANDLAFAKDGSIYFTDSTDIPPAINALGFYDTMASFILTAVQGDRSGRLLRYDPGTKTTSFIAGNFFYSNGVALTPDESAVLVVETALCQISRIYIKGPKAGQRDIFFDDIPGYPDGLIEGENDTYWISLVTMSQPVLERSLHKRFTRWLTPRIPPQFKKIRPGTAVLQVSAEGKLLRYMDDASGSVVNTISAVTETRDGLYLGNLGGNFVSFLGKADYLPQIRA